VSGPFDAFLRRCVSDSINATPAPCDPGCEECEAADCCPECGDPECEGHPEQEPDSLRSLGLSERDFL
jgi:hypothetical protein